MRNSSGELTTPCGVCLPSSGNSPPAVTRHARVKAQQRDCPKRSRPITVPAAFRLALVHLYPADHSTRAGLRLAAPRSPRVRRNQTVIWPPFCTCSKLNKTASAPASPSLTLHPHRQPADTSLPPSIPPAPAREQRVEHSSLISNYSPRICAAS